MDEFITDTCVRGFHVYQDVWRPAIGEELRCERDEDNDKDRYAVAIIKPSVGIVGHVPRYISRLCYHFIMHGGEIYSIITGTRQYSWDLPNGGMHIPCKYRFVGNSEELKKISRYVRNNPAKKALLPSSESSRDDEDVKAKPSTDKVKKEPLSLGDDSECIAGNSKWSSNPTQMTASPITDIPGVAHLKNNPITTKTVAKSAQEIPFGVKITNVNQECQA